MNRPTVLAALCFVALVRVVLLHLNTHLAQRLHGHLNVRDGRHRRALVHQHHALRQARRHQQQSRNELGRRRSINTNHGRLRNTLCARQTGGAQHEGQSVLALLTIHLHTQLTQTLQNRTHRTLTGVRVTVKSELTRQQRRQGGHKTHHGTGKTALNRHSMRLCLRKVEGNDLHIRTERRIGRHQLNTRTQLTQRLNHQR